MEKINMEQLERLLDVLYEENIPKNVILGTLGIEKFEQMTIKQYNFLLILLRCCR